MPSISSTHRLFVSDELLDAAIDAVRYHSIETRRFESVATATQAAVKGFLGTPPPAKKIEELLNQDPIDGPNRIHLAIAETWRNQFSEVGEVVKEALGGTIPVRQRFAVLIRYMLQNGGGSR